MSKRTHEEIKEEYAKVCAQAGHLQYQIHAQTELLKVCNQRLKELNEEALGLVKPEMKEEG